MANYDIPQYPTKRLRYFNNQFLKDQDFIDVDAARIGHERAVLRSLCVAGVCEGLVVTYPAPNKPPSVSAGVAVDKTGRMIVIDQPTDGLANPSALANGNYFVHISFLESEDDKATGEGAPDYTRWKQTPAINATAKTAALPDGVVVLGSCTVTGGVFVGSGTTIGRQYSGLRLPGPNKDAAATLHNTGASDDLAVLTGSLTVRRDAAGQLGPTLMLLNLAGVAGAGGAIDFNGYDQGSSDPSARMRSLDDGNFSSHLTFATKQPGANTNKLVERLRITNTGQVGIGTQTPNDILHVRAADTVGLLESSTTQAALRLATSEGMANHVEFANRPGGRAAISVGTAGDALIVNKDGGVVVSKASGGTGVLSVENYLRFPNDSRRNKIVLYDNYGFGMSDVNISLFCPPNAYFSLRQNSFAGTEVFAVSGANGDIQISGKLALRGNDAWLRLNQDGAFSNGIHTPGNFLPGSLNVGGVNGWDTNPGAGNAWVAGALKVFGGAIVPKVGNDGSSGIQFPTNPGSGTGDEAFLRYSVTSGETTKLILGINNDPDDALMLWQAGAARLTIANNLVSVANSLSVAGVVSWGDIDTRTETRNDAGLQGKAGARSGFFQTSTPMNFPQGATSWWHLLDVRHSNPTNNFALQIAGSFYDQNLWFRKTNDNPAMAWRQFVSADASGNADIGGGLNVSGSTILSGNVSAAGNMQVANRLTANGALTFGGSNWSSYDADATIAKDTVSYKSLMIVGSNQDQGHNRWIRMWDDVQVEGDLTVKNYLRFPNDSPKDKIVIYETSANNRFGIGLNASNISLFCPVNSYFSLRQNGASGTESFKVSAAGVATFFGPIVPKVGNDGSSGIQFPSDPGSGGGDEAFLRYSVTSGETTKLILGINNDPDDALMLWQANAARLTIANNTVSIASNTTISGTLTVSGNTTIGPANTNSTQLWVNGVSWALIHANWSDLRLKRGVESLTGALQKVRKLRAVSFRWNHDDPSLDHTSEKTIGMIAQEVQAVLPGAVLASNNQLSINYHSITALLVEAIKDQDVRINTLEQRLAAQAGKS